MENPSTPPPSLPKASSGKSLDSLIDRFSGAEHIRHFKLLHGRTLGERLKHVTRIMDVGQKKRAKSHREYGHNRKFIIEKFATEEERTCAYVHLFGDFFQEILRVIIADVGKEFQKGRAEPPFYELLEDGKWGWDIKKNAIEKLIQESSRACIQALKANNRIGGLRDD